MLRRSVRQDSHDKIESLKQDSIPFCPATDPLILNSSAIKKYGVIDLDPVGKF